MRNSCYFPTRIRMVAPDFAVMIAIVIMTSIDVIVGINTPKLNVPSTFRVFSDPTHLNYHSPLQHRFQPTYHGRGWLIPPFDGNPIWTAPLAVFPALLACILIFM